MRKSIHSPEYAAVLQILISLRRQAGMTQRDLARVLGREHSFVWRIETGERRLDVVEFHWVCQALGQDTRAVYAHLVAQFDTRAPAAAREAPAPSASAGDAAPATKPHRNRGKGN